MVFLIAISHRIKVHIVHVNKWLETLRTCLGEICLRSRLSITCGLIDCEDNTSASDCKYFYITHSCASVTVQRECVRPDRAGNAHSSGSIGMMMYETCQCRHISPAMVDMPRRSLAIS